MRPEFKISFFILIVIFLILALVLIVFNLNHKKLISQQQENALARIIIDEGVEFKAEVFKTHQEKIKGLSGRKSLPRDQGALFVYDKAGRYNFWMKEMNFAVDIIWIGPDFKIVDITPEAKPESFPERFNPKTPAQYVLEVNAGLAKKYSIDIGTSIIIEGL